MLRDILVGLDSEILTGQCTKLVEDTASFSQEATQLLRKQPSLVDFFNIAEILVGADARLGAGTVLMFLKDAGKADKWLGEIIKSLDKEFCLVSADLLVKEGRINTGWNFSEKAKIMLKEECPLLAFTIATMGLRFGTGFIIGAYLQLELLRRSEENDFGVESQNLPIQ